MTYKMQEASQLLNEALRIINTERNQTYGDVRDDYTKVQGIFRAITGLDLTLTECLMFMVSVKLARLSTNFERNTMHRDSMVDALGYLALISEVQDKEQP
jgi:hypothetical protein